MHIIETSSLSELQKVRICEIWNSDYPENIQTTAEGFESYLQSTSRHRHFLLVDKLEAVLGWAYTFDRDGERWFSILLDHVVHGQGWGSRMVKVLQENETALCGWVVDHDRDQLSNGKPYPSPLAFYLRLGFKIQPEVRLEKETISSVKIVWSKVSK